MGQFPYSSLLDEFGSPGVIQVNDLLRMSDHKKLTTTIPMMCSMVNNNLPTNAFVNDTAEIEKGFASELVTYLVIHKAFTPLDSLVSTPFSIEVGVRSNFGAYVRTDDQFSRSILHSANGVSLQEVPKSARQGLINMRDHDFVHYGVDYGYTSAATETAQLSKRIHNSLKGTPTPSWLKTTWKWLKDFYSEAKPVFSAIMSAAEMASMLTVEEEEIMIDVQFFRSQLRVALNLLKPFSSLND